MPARNVVKEYAADAVYHVYNRGVEKRRIFLDEQDYHTFLNLLKRHLGKPSQDRFGRDYPNYADDIELLAHCLMPNHFHLLVWQYEATAMTRLLRSVCTAYTGYFNKKYHRVGKLFQGVFKARLVQDESYYQHISRYIHLNPAQGPDDISWRTYPFSSIAYYLENQQADWVHPKHILSMFADTKDYENFVQDYTAQKAIWDELKHELADS
jgi:putative transposase